MDDITNHFLYPLEITRQNKDERSRMFFFLNWMKSQGLTWQQLTPAVLEAYLASLQKQDLKNSTMLVYVRTVKHQYQKHLDSGGLEQELIKVKTDTMPDDFVATTIAQIKKALHPDVAKVSYKRPTQVEHLTHEQIEELIGQVEFKTLMDLRDVLVMGLILFTGMSEIELCELRRKDIRLIGAETFIRIPEVFGGKKRMVRVRDDMFYEGRWWQNAYRIWLKETPIDSGFVFRGFFRGGNTIRKNQMQATAVQALLRDYPVHDEQENLKHFTALDLRRTYARRLFDNGMELKDIQKSLGHTEATTVSYIGLPDPDQHLGSHLRISGFKF